MNGNTPEGPRLLLSEECFLAIKGYTAVPTETVTGNMSADRTEGFRRAAKEHLPVSTIRTESGIVSEVLGDFIVAELETDRLQLDRYVEFVSKYAEIQE